MFCGDCGGSYPLGDLARFGNDFICPHCKPAYLQRLNRGPHANTATAAPASVTGVTFAGFWIRSVATIIDFLIIGLVTVPLFWFSGLNNFDVNNPDVSPAMAAQVAAVTLLALTFAVAYEIWFVTNKGGTPGKLALNLRVITIQGLNLSYAQSTGRYFARVISGIPLYLGYVMAAFDSQKRALHDYVCTTRVIYRS